MTQFPRVYTAVSTRLGIAGLRDLTSRDIEPIVRYWYDSGEEHLDFLGIDRRRLGDEDTTRERFRQAVPTGDLSQRTAAWAITLADDLIGYTLLNRYAPDVNYSHWHIIAPDRRASGISTALYPHRIKLYFDLFPIERLTHQTRTRNSGVNRMLDRYVPVSETVWLEQPDGFAGPGEFHLRYVRREDIARLLARAATPPS